MNNELFKIKWIRIGDELPPENKEVLVFIYGMIQFGICSNLKMLYWKDADWTYTDKITHWMEIPEPPQEK